MRNGLSLDWTNNAIRKYLSVAAAINERRKNAAADIRAASVANASGKQDIVRSADAESAEQDANQRKICLK